MTTDYITRKTELLQKIEYYKQEERKYVEDYKFPMPENLKDFLGGLTTSEQIEVFAYFTQNRYFDIQEDLTDLFI